MYYEASIKHDYLTENNEVKSKTSKVIINNVDLFAEAEYAALKYAADNWKADNFSEPDVTFIKRSRIREFANSKTESSRIYFATLEDTFIDVKGKEKHTKYIIGIYAEDIDTAKANVAEYMRQGMQDLTLVGLNETKFEDVIE